MPNLTSAIRRERGFTLVEIMAVVFVIGVMISLVAMRVGGLPERELAVEAQKLYQKIRLLAEEAEFSGAEMGLSLTDEGYELLHFNEATLKWIPFSEGDFKPATLEKRYILVLDLKKKMDTELLYKKEKREKSRDYGEKRYEEPEIMFFSDGQITPFELILKDKNIPKLRYVVSGISPGRLGIQSYAN